MQARVVSLHYDAALGAFEARVDVERDGCRFRYPCRLQAPESAPRDWLDQVLTRQALAMSDTPRPDAATSRASLLAVLSETLSRALHPRQALRDIPVRAAEPRRPQARH